MDTIEAFEAYEPELTRYAASRVGNAAEDLVQKAFIALIEYREEVTEPKAFLFRVLIQDIVDYQRAENRHSRLLEQHYPHSNRFFREQDAVVDALCQVEQAGKIKQIISTMLPVVGDVLLEGMPYEKAAEKHGLKPGAVRTTIWRARATIRAQMEV